MHDQRCNNAENCRREIESITAQLLAGSTDMHGLLLALRDWGCELRLIEEEEDGHQDDDDDNVYGYHFHSQEEYEEWEREWGPE